MRLIGHLKNDREARKFGDFLFLEGIENNVEAENDGTYAIWVLDEEQLASAGKLFERFRREPDAKAYEELESKANERRRDRKEQEEVAEAKTFDGREVMRKRRGGIGEVTLTLIGICIVVAIWSKLGSTREPIGFLFMSEQIRELGLPEIRAGQIWRLFTPMLIHFGVMHIIFNMLWLKDLGTMVERLQGGRFLLVFILVTSIISNLCQFAVKGPGFGGMSGVIFGLFGYIWMKGKFDFKSGYSMDTMTVYLMIAWFFFCFTGMLPIANGAHTGGLLTGLAWGYISALRNQPSRRA